MYLLSLLACMNSATQRNVIWEFVINSIININILNYNVVTHELMPEAERPSIRRFPESMHKKARLNMYIVKACSIVQQKHLYAHTCICSKMWNDTIEPQNDKQCGKNSKWLAYFFEISPCTIIHMYTMRLLIQLNHIYSIFIVGHLIKRILTIHVQ